MSGVFLFALDRLSYSEYGICKRFLIASGVEELLQSGVASVDYDTGRQVTHDLT